MLKRSHFLLGVILVTAALLTYLKVPVASSQGLQLVVELVQGELPLDDPFAQAWEQARPVEVPLSAQNIARPMQLDARTRSVTARALQSESHLAVMVEWMDSSQDDKVVAVQDFADAVALQFPLVEGQPFFCMGQAGGNVSIWHWKADWQSDLTVYREMEMEYPHMYVDMYPFAEVAGGQLAQAGDYTDIHYLTALAAGNPFAEIERLTPVENLIAGGFGSLTSRPPEAQTVSGQGSWQDGRWRVVFSRALDTADAEDVQFASGKSYPIAFAVWDGASHERNGQKSTSQWVTLQMPSTAPTPVQVTPPGAAAPAWYQSELVRNLIIIGTVLAILAVVVIYFILPE
jgi:hypothetical protein